MSCWQSILTMLPMNVLTQPFIIRSFLSNRGLVARDIGIIWTLKQICGTTRPIESESIPGRFASIIRFKLCSLDVYNILKTLPAVGMAQYRTLTQQAQSPVQSWVLQTRVSPTLTKATPFSLNRHADSVYTTNNEKKKVDKRLNTVKLKHWFLSSLQNLFNWCKLLKWDTEFVFFSTDA